jgi:hypothetical protein
METAGAKVNLAWILADQGRCPESEAMAREGMAAMQRIHPGGHYSVSHAQSILGECLAARGRDREAEPLLLESYPILQKNPGGAWGLAALRRIITFYERRGNQAKAEEYRKLLPPTR